MVVLATHFRHIALTQMNEHLANLFGLANLFSLATSQANATHTPANLGAHNQLTSWRKSSRPIAVGWCVCNFTPTVGVIAPINTDSNVELAVAVNPQSALGKEVSGSDLTPQAYIRWRVGWCVHPNWLVCAGFFHNPTVGGKLINKKS